MQVSTLYVIVKLHFISLRSEKKFKRQVSKRYSRCKCRSKIKVQKFAVGKKKNQERNYSNGICNGSTYISRSKIKFQKFAVGNKKKSREELFKRNLRCKYIYIPVVK